MLELLKDRKAVHAMKILVVSGYLNPETREHLAKTCADSVLDKLSDIPVLVKTVASLIRSEAGAFSEEVV